jgi:hypothetical protein
MTRATFKNRKQLTAEPPFTPDCLRQIIRDAVRREYKIPTGAAIEVLGGILNQHHAWFYIAQKTRPLNVLLKETANALAVLDKNIPQILTLRMSPKDVFDRQTLKATKWMGDILADDNRKVLLHPDNLTDHVRDWRWLAGVLPIDIITAMQSTNPNYPKGHSKTGPTAKIISALIPLITGDTVSALGVGTQLIKLNDTPERAV